MGKIEQQWKARYGELCKSYSDDPKTLVRKRAELEQEFQGQLNHLDLLAPPWPWLKRGDYHHFWRYYFENVEPNGISGAQAWEFLVPLRVNVPVKVGSPWPADGPKCRVMVEGFFYPNGVAVVAMARLSFKRNADGNDTASTSDEPGLSTERALERALQVRWDPCFPVTLTDGTADTMKLDSLAAQLLTYLRERAQGTRGPSKATVPATRSLSRLWSRDASGTPRRLSRPMATCTRHWRGFAVGRTIGRKSGTSSP